VSIGAGPEVFVWNRGMSDILLGTHRALFHREEYTIPKTASASSISKVPD